MVILFALMYFYKLAVKVVFLFVFYCADMDTVSSILYSYYIIELTFVRKLFIGFFNTGAYQDTLSGYGGIKHCLLPSPPHILIDEKKKNEFTYRVFAEEQTAESMMKILGY